MLGLLIRSAGFGSRDVQRLKGSMLSLRVVVYLECHTLPLSVAYPVEWLGPVT